MNIAVDPLRTAPGDRACAARSDDRARRTGRAVHARGADLQRAGAIALYRAATASARRARAPRYYRDNGEDAVIMWRTADNARAPAQPDDPRDRDELRRHLRGGRHGARADRLERDLVAGDPRPLRRRRAGDRLPPPPRADRRRGRRRAEPGRRSSCADVELVAVTRGPGLVAALLVGLATAKALAAAHELPLARRRSPARPRRRRPSWSRAVRAAVRRLIASGGHTFLARVATAGPTTRCSARRSTTPPARRSTRARGCSGSAIRAARRSSGWPATATRRRSRSRPPRGWPGWTSRSRG